MERIPVLLAVELTLENNPVVVAVPDPISNTPLFWKVPLKSMLPEVVRIFPVDEALPVNVSTPDVELTKLLAPRVVTPPTVRAFDPS